MVFWVFLYRIVLRFSCECVSLKKEKNNTEKRSITTRMYYNFICIDENKKKTKKHIKVREEFFTRKNCFQRIIFLCTFFCPFFILIDSHVHCTCIRHPIVPNALCFIFFFWLVKTIRRTLFTLLYTSFDLIWKFTACK